MKERASVQLDNDTRNREKLDVIKEMLDKIRQAPIQAFHVMEVCGTHTRAIYQYGIRPMVEPKIRLLSGPGCPVCVTSEEYIDVAINLLQNPEVIVASFGDMMKVNGKQGNLLQQKEKGKEIRIVYAPLDVITMAVENKQKEIVFLAVGFETTAPIIALAIKTAEEKQLRNLTFLIGLKRMEPILHHILSDPYHNIQGMICPGHVAAVMGSDYFRFITDLYKIPAVISGFEATDIIGALYTLTKQRKTKQPEFQNQYRTCVTTVGNQEAKKLMEEVFDYREGYWRGIGLIQASELTLCKKYQCYDAEFIYKSQLKKAGIATESNYDEYVRTKRVDQSCECSEVLIGKKLPRDCIFFHKSCTPSNPIGPCMVSSEGACAVAYQFNNSTECECPEF